MVSIHLPTMLYYSHSLCVLKKLSMIRQNLAVPVGSASQQLDEALLTIVLNTCTANLTFMLVYDLPGAR